MTSQIIFSTIDGNFPVPGVDNDSRGFRNNFTTIKTGLSVAKSEITALQEKSVLVADLETNSPVTNDLFGSIIKNGEFSEFYGSAYSTSASTDVDVLMTEGEVFLFTLSADNITFTLRDWPVLGLYAVKRIHFRSNGSGTFTPILNNANGSLIFPTGFPSIDVSYTTDSIAVTATTATTNELTTVNTSDLSLNQRVVFPNADVFGGLEQNVNYYVKTVNTGTGKFTVSKTLVNGVAGATEVLTTATGTTTGLAYTTKDQVVEVWSFDGGVNAYVRFLGEF